MREPNLGDLEFDPKSTRQIRQKMARNPAVKITINIDAEALAILRAKSAKTGIPYQRLLESDLETCAPERDRNEKPARPT